MRPGVTVVVVTPKPHPASSYTIKIQGTVPLKKDRDQDLHDDTKLDLESRLAIPTSTSLSAHQVEIE